MFGGAGPGRAGTHGCTPAELPDQRRHRIREDHPALHAAGAVPSRRTAGPDRGRLRTEPRPSARCVAGIAARKPRRRRWRGPGRTGPPGPPDAAGPAGGGGMPRRRSPGTADRHEHRTHRRRRNHPREHSGRRACAADGAGRPRRAWARTPCGCRSPAPSTSWCTWSGPAAGRHVACIGVVDDGRPRTGSFRGRGGAGGNRQLGPAWPRAGPDGLALTIPGWWT